MDICMEIVIIGSIILLILPIIVKNIIENGRTKEMKKQVEYSLQVSKNMEFIFDNYLEQTKREFEIFNKYQK